MAPVEVLPHVDERVLDRMVPAVELVKQRVLRATQALAAHGVPYAVAGENPVAAWVAKVDPAAIRNTADVDLLIARSDFEWAKAALSAAGFIYRHSGGIDMFLDGPEGEFREAVNILFAGERVRSDDLLPTPTQDETRPDDKFQVVDLEAPVRMKLIANRDEDRTHLRDMLEVGMFDESWLPKYPLELPARVKRLTDPPNG